MESRPIRKLSPEVIGRIAAGEVVERPASAVKELVENSIDAGATAVTVELTDGGITALRVSDNGRGIPAGQIKMAFERHATSKLADSDELFNVRTLGFRGEALASVAAVSKVTCVTRAAGAESGVRARVEGGAFVEISEAACAAGTSLTVKDLFYNAPVRLKFLKKPSAEAALVSDYILRLILSRPDIAFRFSSQGKTLYRSVGDGTLESALYCVYGGDALKAMRKVHGAMNGVIVDGYVGAGELSRGNRQQQSFFVNGRYFRDDAISRALEEGCRGWVMIGRYPMCALTLTVPYPQVDVNVHPNKLEVRFQNAEGVAEAVERLTREALSAVTVRDAMTGAANGPRPARAPEIQVVEVRGDAPPADGAAQSEARADGAQLADSMPPADGTTNPADSSAAPLRPARVAPPRAAASLGERAVSPRALPPEDVSAPWPAPQAQAPASPVTQPSPVAPQAQAIPASQPSVASPAPPVPSEQERLLPQDDAPITFIGAAFCTYLLFEAGDRLLLVDQHAAHERVLYDRLMKRYDGPNISQALLTPQLVRLNARDCARLAELLEPLAEAGFELEPFDDASVAVRAVPVILGENAPVRELLLETLDDLRLSRGPVTRDRLRRQVAQAACKHAVKGGDALSRQDALALVREMLASGVQPTCPHGRPIVTELTKRELEKRFKRVP